MEEEKELKILKQRVDVLEKMVDEIRKRFNDEKRL